MYEGLKIVIDFFVEPFLDFLIDKGYSSKVISLGIGEIQFFSMELLELTEIVLTYIIITMFLLIIYKVLRLIIKIITGGNI